VTEDRQEERGRSDAKRRAPALAAWALAAVPLVGVVELGLHFKQQAEVVPDADWGLARAAVSEELREDDLVLFAPSWADPLGRRFFGDEIVTMKRAAFPDTSRFARAFEVSIRGKHRAEIAGWKKISERTLGKITVGLYENPSPAKVLTDLASLMTPDGVSVSRVEGSAETPCTFQRGASQGGSTAVPQGMLVPPSRFVCPGGYAGVAVLHALDHRPHLCIAASPLGPGATLRLRFANVTFGRSLHGHAGMQWVTERTASGDIIELTFSAFDRPIGRRLHAIGSGWTGFELPTEEHEGKKGELVADVSGASAHRGFCFEADTR
jgi:hypothetical protein